MVEVVYRTSDKTEHNTIGEARAHEELLKHRILIERKIKAACPDIDIVDLSEVLDNSVAIYRVLHHFYKYTSLPSLEKDEDEPEEDEEEIAQPQRSVGKYRSKRI
jgi:hypothetical protein